MSNDGKGIEGTSQQEVNKKDTPAQHFKLYWGILNVSFFLLGETSRGITEN